MNDVVYSMDERGSQVLDRYEYQGSLKVDLAVQYPHLADAAAG